MNWPSFPKNILCSWTFRKAMPPTCTSHFPGPSHHPQRGLTATLAPVFRRGELHPFHLHEDGEARKRITFFGLLENLSKSCSENLHMFSFHFPFRSKGHAPSCGWKARGRVARKTAIHGPMVKLLPQRLDGNKQGAKFHCKNDYPPKKGGKKWKPKNGSENDFPVQRTQPVNFQIPS